VLELASRHERARKIPTDVNGPWPSDTVFLKGRDGLLDPVVTPARGTAFGTAGKGVANLGAMRNDFDVLCRMCLNYRRARTNSGGS
jgi:4-hydroxythreonine-4-phosphate dehydrogenase